MLGLTTCRVASRQSFTFGRSGVYGLDLVPGRQFVEKIVIPQSNQKKKTNYITDTPFEHYYFGCNKRKHFAGQNAIRFISIHNELHA